MITLENTFAGYGEQSTQGVYVCIKIALKSINKLSIILIGGFICSCRMATLKYSNGIGLDDR